MSPVPYNVWYEPLNSVETMEYPKEFDEQEVAGLLEVRQNIAIVSQYHKLSFNY